MYTHDKEFYFQVTKDLVENKKLNNHFIARSLPFTVLRDVIIFISHYLFWTNNHLDLRGNLFVQEERETQIFLAFIYFPSYPVSLFHLLSFSFHFVSVAQIYPQQRKDLQTWEIVVSKSTVKRSSNVLKKFMKTGLRTKKQNGEGPKQSGKFGAIRQNEK